jgi:hypothetical protein
MQHKTIQDILRASGFNKKNDAAPAAAAFTLEYNKKKVYIA